MDYTYAYLRRAQLNEHLVEAELQRRNRRAVVATRLSRRAARAARRAQQAADGSL